MQQFPQLFLFHHTTLLLWPAFNNLLDPQNMKDLNKFNKQIPKLLYLVQVNDCVEIITAFLLKLIDMTVKVNQDDYIFLTPSPIPGSYNPASGTAHYFSQTGEQLHSMPDFQVNKTSTKKTMMTILL